MAQGAGRPACWHHARREAAKRLGIRYQALQEALAAMDADSPKVTSDLASA